MRGSKIEKLKNKIIIKNKIKAERGGFSDRKTVRWVHGSGGGHVGKHRSRVPTGKTSDGITDQGGRGRRKSSENRTERHIAMLMKIEKK